MTHIEKLIAVSALAIGIITYAIGEYFTKIYTLTHQKLLILWILFAYTIAVIAWIPGLCAVKNLTIYGTIWSVVCLASVPFVGMYIFHEPISIYQIIGLVLAFLSCIFLCIS